MVNITYATNLRHTILDIIAGEVFSVACSGVSTGAYGSTIHLVDGSQANQDKAQAIFDNWAG